MNARWAFIALVLFLFGSPNGALFALGISLILGE